MSQYARFNTDKRDQRIASLREYMFPAEFLEHCAKVDEGEHWHKSTVGATPRHVWEFRIENGKRNAAVHRTRPEVWAERIERITDPTVRVMVARIVWWDFFSGQEVASRWNHLDAYLGDDCTPPAMKEIAEAEKELSAAQYLYTCASVACSKNRSYANRKRLQDCKMTRDIAKGALARAKSKLPDKETIILALWSVGYPPAMARNRVIQGE